jgi:serine/threonine protein phosphatase PrpC
VGVIPAKSPRPKAPTQRDRLVAGVDLLEGELHPLGHGLAAIYTARAPGEEDGNEDACVLVPFDEQSGVLAVADGAGGLPAGAKASSLAVHSLRSAVRAAARDGGDLRGAILDGIERAGREVLALGVGAGTTLAVVEIRGRKMRPYHVGDSQIMVVGPGGKLKHCSTCHSPTGYAVKAGLLTAEDALVHEERYRVSNLVGFHGMHIEVGPTIELSPRDTVLVGSDGLFDNLHVEEIAALCRQGQLLGLMHKLTEACAARMAGADGGKPSKPDDLTMLAYRRRASP